MKEEEPFRITIESFGTKSTWEGPWDSNIHDVISGFVGCMVGQTWNEETICHGFGEYLKRFPEDDNKDM